MALALQGYRLCDTAIAVLSGGRASDTSIVWAIVENDCRNERCAKGKLDAVVLEG